VVCGFGDVGKGCAAALRSFARAGGGDRDRFRSAPCKPRWRVIASPGWRRWRRNANIFVTATGNLDIITLDHMRQMKDRAILCNIGHFDNEIDVAGLRNFKWQEIKPQVDEIDLSRRQTPDSVGSGAPGQPGLRHGTSRLCDERQLHQPKCWRKLNCGRTPASTTSKSTFCPKELDEKVAFLHLSQLGVEADQTDG
jgi:adenosylhomocysteinase